MKIKINDKIYHLNHHVGIQIDDDSHMSMGYAPADDVELVIHDGRVFIDGSVSLELIAREVEKTIKEYER